LDQALADSYVRPGLWVREPFLSIDVGRLPFTLGVEIWPMGDGQEAPPLVRLSLSPWRRPLTFPPRAKAVGTYMNSALAKATAVAAGCDEALQLDPDSGRVAVAGADEVFLTGAASELVPVGSFEQRVYPERRPVFDAIRSAFRDTVRGRRRDAQRWLTPVGRPVLERS
jgi:branched-subunit amino acid aminotransferase/4-amino-4-deoxychorismate lyase